MWTTIKMKGKKERKHTAKTFDNNDKLSIEQQLKMERPPIFPLFFCCWSRSSGGYTSREYCKVFRWPFYLPLPPLPFWLTITASVGVVNWSERTTNGKFCPLFFPVTWPECLPTFAFLARTLYESIFNIYIIYTPRVFALLIVSLYLCVYQAEWPTECQS